MSTRLLPVAPLLLLLACHGKGGDDGADEPGELSVSPRFYRLTHDQWERTTQDLLQLDAPSGLSAGFIGDTLHDGFANNGDALEVNTELFRDYQLAAETLATTVVTDPALYARVVPEDPRKPVEPTSTRVQVEDDGAITAENGATYDEGWMLWSAGALYVPMPIEQAGTYTVATRMRSTDCADGVFAEVEVTVNGQSVGTFETTAAAATYSGELYLDVGTQTLSVDFLNDCYDEAAGADRNLVVDWVAWTGPEDGVGPGSAGEAEARAWVTRFGARAFRRPLTTQEVDSFTALFTQGPELVGSGDDFADGVRLVLTAILQSPAFLYRVEASATPDGSGAIPLDDWELASKLSYALWGTMPDEALFTLAAQGGLSDAAQLRQVARDMLADERATTAVADFHDQLLQWDKVANVVKDTDNFPMYDADTPAYLREEAERFVDAVVWDEGGGVHELYGADWTVGNRAVAALYGIPGPADDDTWERLALDPSRRAGLLTQPWFLATNADSTTPSIIHRGVFVNRQVLCVDIPDPPPMVPALPAAEEGQTNRERVEAHTGEGTCGAGCHSGVINPPGYALESYDALGMWRDTDNGQPVDAASSYAFSDREYSWTTGVEFAAIVAAHPGTHTCYSTRWLEYLLARAATEADGARVAPLAEASAAGASVQELIVELVADDSFRYRVDEVAP